MDKKRAEVLPRHRDAVIAAWWSEKDGPLPDQAAAWRSGEWSGVAVSPLTELAQMLADAEEPGRAAQLALMELAEIPAIRERMHVGQSLSRDLVPVVRELLSGK